MKNSLLSLTFLFVSIAAYCQPCETNEIGIELTTDDFASEISWTISQDGGVVLSSDQTYEDNSIYEHLLCLADGCYILSLIDGENEGWEGAVVNFLVNGEALFPQGLEVGGSLEHEFAVNVNCNPLLGCTDPLALNYNPDAVTDDGSCVYSACDVDFIVIPDTNGLNTMWIFPNFTALGNIDVLWDFGDGTSSTELFPEHDYDGNGPFNLCLTVSVAAGDDQCESTFCQWIEGDMIQNDDSTGGAQSEGFNLRIINNSGSVGIESNSIDNSINVFPNPFTDESRLELSVQETLISTIGLFDVQGKLLKSETVQLNPGENSIELPFDNLEPGIYLIQLRTAKGNFTRKIVKQ